MRLIAALATGIVALGATALASGSESSARNFSGNYRMTGKGFGAHDSAYAGTCRIDAADRGYDVSCYNADTRHTYVGKGLAQGDVLAITIGDTLRGDHNAFFAGEYLVVYRARADGVLEGTWLHTISGAAGAETLEPAH
jgi:hypothetical protein